MLVRIQIAAASRRLIPWKKALLRPGWQSTTSRSVVISGCSLTWTYSHLHMKCTRFRWLQRLNPATQLIRLLGATSSFRTDSCEIYPTLQSLPPEEWTHRFYLVLEYFQPCTPNIQNLLQSYKLGIFRGKVVLPCVVLRCRKADCPVIFMQWSQNHSSLFLWISGFSRGRKSALARILDSSSSLSSAHL